MSHINIKYICLLLLLKCVTNSDTEGKFAKTLSGIELSHDSNICRELPFKKIEEFSICFFLKVEEAKNISNSWEQNDVIFTLWDSDSFLKLEFDKEGFVVDFNWRRVNYRDVHRYSKWKILCLQKQSNQTVEVISNYIQLKMEPIKEEEDLKRPILKNTGILQSNESLKSGTSSLNFSSLFVPTDGNASICFGDINLFDYCSDCTLNVAAVNITSNFTDIKGNDICIDMFEYGQLLDFNNEGWIARSATKMNLTISELCLDTYVISFINQSGDDYDHYFLCKKLNGRFLNANEVKYFSEYFQSFRSKIESESNVTLQFPLYSFYILGGYYTIFSYSLASMSVEESSPSRANFTFCISSQSTIFNFYGIYHLVFTLENKDFSFYFQDRWKFFIKKRHNTWELSSRFSERNVLKLNSVLPVGRHNWTFRNRPEEVYTMTLTHCNESEFTCSDGRCLPFSKRCNGFAECSDRSDEENCMQLEKEGNYLTEVPPPPNKDESIFKVFYNVTLLNIYYITSTKGSIKMDVEIDLAWFDKRIKFRINKNRTHIDTEEIWSPELRFFGNVHPGYLIVIEDKDSFKTCQIDKVFLTTFDTKYHRSTNPYKDLLIEGEELMILYSFKAVMDVPCPFNLRRYPFGKQSCNMAFKIDDLQQNSSFEFVYDGTDTHLKYEGNKELGEYNLLDVNEGIDSKGFVVVTIQLENLYGFHVLNSFIPSVLICIITYSTLFFPIKNFSDRVMVSLTSLLVLAALFTQASSKSAITPYFKLLDIWYVVLIIFCFTIVIFNILLHKIASMKEKKEKIGFVIHNEVNLDEDKEINALAQPLWKKKISFYNFAAIVFFSSFYVLFLFFFCLAAAEII